MNNKKKKTSLTNIKSSNTKFGKQILSTLVIILALISATKDALCDVLPSAQECDEKISAEQNSYKSECENLKRRGLKVSEEGETYNYLHAVATEPKLIYAIRQDYVSCAKAFIERGDNVNAKNEEGSTALMITAARGNIDLVKFLIRHGANVKDVDNDGATALSIAIDSGNRHLVKYLIQQGAPVSGVHAKDKMVTALDNAVLQSDTEMVEFLLKNGADINEKIFDGTTALFSAVLLGNQNIVNILLKNGADVNVQQLDGMTPLMFAVARGNDNIVRTLINHGADVNAKTNGKEISVPEGYEVIKMSPLNPGGTALMLASARGNIDLVKFLIRHGANVKDVDKYGNTALTVAIQSGNKDLVKYLIQQGAPVRTNVKDKMVTALNLAVETGDAEMVKILLQNGVDINEKTFDGKTALFGTFKSDKQHLMNILLENGADVNAKMLNGMTPLMFAVARGNDNIVRTLINHGADVNAKTNGKEISVPDQFKDKMKGIKVDSDVTALMIAIETEREQIAKLLIEHGANIYERYANGRTAAEMAPSLWHLEEFAATVRKNNH